LQPARPQSSPPQAEVPPGLPAQASWALVLTCCELLRLLEFLVPSELRASSALFAGSPEFPRWLHP